MSPPDSLGLKDILWNIETLIFDSEHFSGLIDPVKETEKLEKKRSALSSSLEKLKKSMEMEGYETKVPADVRAANAEKLEQTKTELIRLGDAITALKNM